MWIYLKNAYLSISQDMTDETRLIISARTLNDLKAGVKYDVFYGIDHVEFAQLLKYTPEAEYHYSISVPRAFVAQLIAAHVDAVQYDDLPSVVSNADEDRGIAYREIQDASRLHFKRFNVGRQLREVDRRPTHQVNNRMSAKDRAIRNKREVARRWA